MHVEFRLNTQALKRQSGGARTTSLVGLTVLLVALSVVLGAPAAVAMTTSATPSSTEPYRACPMPAPGSYECEEIVEPAAYVHARAVAGEILPAEEGTGELGGWSPENLKSAYKLPATGGKGETVAIVDAFNYPDAEADLKVFREHYKLVYKGTETACTRANECFKKINQKGESAESETATLYPTANRGWSKEMSLDLDMVSAVCPECKLLLVESNTNSLEDLDTAEAKAATESPVAISNSWGNAGEFFEETEFDTYFDHPGIPVVFAAGDTGYGPKYPATSPYVISAGGTQLTKEPLASRKWSEEVWHNEPAMGDSTGSGCSEFEPKPAWQTDKGCAKRTDNDVSAVAYKLSAYDSYEQTGEERWTTRSGTSASTPIIAGVEAVSPAHFRSLGAQAFYVPGTKASLFDITVGNDGTCTPVYLCTAEPGYDGPTGTGTPDGAFTLGPPENTSLPVASPTTPDQAVPESSSTGSWTNEPTSYTYQWERCNATGGECTAISGATSAKYTPVEADVEHALVVKVTAKTSEGEGTARSKATNAVRALGEKAEYALPSKSGPWGITAGPDGNLWYTDHLTNKIGKITTSGTITEYALPAGSDPFGISAGPAKENALWYTDYLTNKIGKITTSGTITEYSLPTGSQPLYITVGPDGNLWYTNQTSSKIGKITTSGTITEYSLPRESQPRGITAGPDGNVWYTDFTSNKIGKITTSGTVTEYSLPEKSAPWGMAVGPDGNLWYADSNSNKIGKITTSGTITEYSPAGANSPIDITAGPDGNLWYTNERSSKIARITTTGTITEYSQSEVAEPYGITLGSDENLWYADYRTSKIGRIVP